VAILVNVRRLLIAALAVAAATNGAARIMAGSRVVTLAVEPSLRAGPSYVGAPTLGAWKRWRASGLASSRCRWRQRGALVLPSDLRRKSARRCQHSGLDEAGAKDEKAAEPPKILGPAPDMDEALPLNSGSPGPVPLARVASRKFKIMFTCKICEHRNSHMISRLAYNQGIVIATCPGCNSRHLISDKTGLLDYGLWDVEMLAKEGESVTRLGADGFRKVAGKAARADSASSTPQVVGELPEEQLLVRNSDGVVEAIAEGSVGLGRAAEFLSEGAKGPDDGGGHAAALGTDGAA